MITIGLVRAVSLTRSDMIPISYPTRPPTPISQPTHDPQPAFPYYDSLLPIPLHLRPLPCRPAVRTGARRSFQVDREQSDEELGPHQDEHQGDRVVEHAQVEQGQQCAAVRVNGSRG
jgi:hypothetical protein